MKTIFKVASLIVGMFLSFNAMGGSGIGGGVFGKTKLLLQSFAHSEAILTLPGDITNIPETDTTPRLEIPDNEFQDLVAEACKLDLPQNEPFVTLSTEAKDGSTRNFEFYFMGVPCKEPFAIFVKEVEAGTVKSVE